MSVYSRFHPFPTLLYRCRFPVFGFPVIIAGMNISISNFRFGNDIGPGIAVDDQRKFFQSDFFHPDDQLTAFDRIAFHSKSV